MNNRGDVVGIYHTESGKSYGMLYDAALNVSIDLDSLLAPVGWRLGGAMDINDKGWITGGLEDDGTSPTEIAAFIYRPGENPEFEIVEFPSGSGYPRAINEFGDICGEAKPLEGGYERAFVRYTDGDGNTVFDYFGPEQSTARDLSGSAANPLVQVVGTIGYGYMYGEGFRYTPAVGMADTLGTSAYGINENAQIVGAMTVKRPTKPFRYADGSGMLDLAELDRKAEGYAKSVNVQGCVVGVYGSPFRPFLFVDGYEITHIDDLLADKPEASLWLGAYIFDCLRINDLGQITAVTRYVENNQGQLLLLNPDTPPSEW